MQGNLARNPTRPDEELPKMPDEKILKRSDEELLRMPDEHFLRRPDEELLRRPNEEVLRRPDEEVLRRPDEELLRRPDEELMARSWQSQRSTTPPKIATSLGTTSRQKKTWGVAPPRPLLSLCFVLWQWFGNGLLMG